MWLPVELQNILVEQLELCVEYLWKSERYELIAEVNKPIIAVFEKQRDFKVSSFLLWKSMWANSKDQYF